MNPIMDKLEQPILAHCAASATDQSITLCGQKWRLWCALPDRFLLGLDDASSPPPCPECLAHPDFPLLVLGGMA
jgi:hypothetical protein